MDEAELQALGLYDPDDEHAALRLELLRYLEGLGATEEDLLAWKDGLAGLALALGIRGGRLLTFREAADRGNGDVEDLRRYWRAAGFADAEPEARVVTQAFADLAQLLPSVETFFGPDANLQLLRVLGASMARVADAVVSLFLVNVEPTRRADPVGLAIARANEEAAQLVPLLAPTLDVLFRQHLLVSQRPTPDQVDANAYETRSLVVGFVDLVGSTELGERLTLGDLGALLTRFEHLSSDTVTGGGGRVIKHIGDEVLFTAPSAASAGAIALALAAAVDADPDLGQVRAGLASGPVMMRDGDVFGPTVNLAARVVTAAAPGEVLVTSDLAAASGLPTEDCGSHQFKGIAGEVSLHRLVRAP